MTPESKSDIPHSSAYEDIALDQLVFHTRDFSQEKAAILKRRMKENTEKTKQQERSAKSLRQIGINKRLWEDPEKREQILEGMRQAWKDPDVRIKRIASIKQGWQEKKRSLAVLHKEHG